jgi:winged helix DNA-binding protein
VTTPTTDAARRATAQLLHRPSGGPVAIVRHLLAVQAQDERAFPLALRARGTGFGASAVRDALTQGELVVCWLMRGTLHLVAREDHGWLLALTARRNRGANARRLRGLGIGERRADRLVAALGSALPLPRAEVAPLLGTTGQQTPHLIMRAALEGVCVLGWGRELLPAPPAGPAGDLGERYLAAHAPAAPEDLAAWSGIGLRAARSALDRPQHAPEPEPLPPRLLPAFDEFVLGWRDHRIRIRGGMVPAVAVTGGRIETTWSRRAPPPPAYAEELADVSRFLSA